ncbi:MAG: hypothetical protein IJ157_02990 [Clostridia bacterium]|nr:hypothetical protein [Clostridia bacterium]
MIILERWKKHLPQDKTPEELDRHYEQMEEMKLEKGDRLAMFLAALVTFLPVILIALVIFLIPMLIFRVL